MKPASGPATVETGKLGHTPEETVRRDQEADQEFQEGRGIQLQEIVDWVRSWFTPHEVPRPKSGKIS